MLYREIAGCTLRETREGLGTWPRAHPHSGSALKKIYVSCSGSYSHHVQFCTFYVYVQDFHPGGFEEIVSTPILIFDTLRLLVVQPKFLRDIKTKQTTTTPQLQLPDKFQNGLDFAFNIITRK